MSLERPINLLGCKSDGFDGGSSLWLNPILFSQSPQVYFSRLNHTWATINVSGILQFRLHRIFKYLVHNIHVIGTL